MSNYQPEVTGAIEEAEEALIGAILIESVRSDKAIHEVSKLIEPWDFRGCLKSDKPDRWVWRGRIYYAMTLCDRPHIINVAHKMIELDIFHALDASLMSHCEAGVPCSLDYMDYARVVKDYSIKRQAKYYADKGDIEKLKQLPIMNMRRGFEI